MELSLGNQAAKNPGVAAVLSFFVPGLGHIYGGKIGKGVTILIYYSIFAIPNAIFIAYAYGDAQSLVPILILSGMALFIWVRAITTAYKLVSESNKVGSALKKCSYCAELVKEEAILCRFCNNTLEGR